MLPPHVAARWRELERDAHHVTPHLRVTLEEGPAKDFPTERAYAYCECVPDGSSSVIRVAPDFGELPDHHREAILRHELGHAVRFANGELRHSEREADETAFQIWGDPILYYGADALQSVRLGRPGRPSWLPQ